MPNPEPRSTTTPNLLLRDTQAAVTLSISRRTWWKLVAAGQAPKPVKIGRSTRWKYDDLKAFVGGLGK